jgi:hypothetical protein
MFKSVTLGPWFVPSCSLQCKHGRERHITGKDFKIVVISMRFPFLASPGLGECSVFHDTRKDTGRSSGP